MFVECPSCQEQVHAKLRNCTRCGAVMPHFAQEEAAAAAAAADDGYVPITERLGRPYQSQAAGGGGGGGSPPPPPRMPGGGGYGREPMPHVPNHLVWAILTTLFCCLPLGIVSIVFAAKVDGLLAGGDYDGAVSASNSAKTWSIAAAIVSIVGWALYIGFFVLLGVAGGMAGK